MLPLSSPTYTAPSATVTKPSTDAAVLNTQPVAVRLGLPGVAERRGEGELELPETCGRGALLLRARPTATAATISTPNAPASAAGRRRPRRRGRSPPGVADAEVRPSASAGAWVWSSASELPPGSAGAAGATGS